MRGPPRPPGGRRTRYHPQRRGSSSRGRPTARRRSSLTLFRESVDSEPCPANACGHEPRLVRKDADLELDGLALAEKGAAERLAAQLERDTAFLRDEGVMDYSLLLGVHRGPPLAQKLGARSPNVHLAPVCGGVTWSLPRLRRDSR